MAFVMLDPVITVHPDQVLFEVFSKDEGTYAKLGIDRDAFGPEGVPTCGTTNIDFSQAFSSASSRCGAPRDPPEHRAGGCEVRHARRGRSAGEDRSASRTRGCAASSRCSRPPRCRATGFDLAPIDLYNALRHLRMHADRKGQRRGLRIELVPGEPPRLVLEPWNG